MGFKFEKLIVWQKSVDLSAEIHKLTLQFPKEEIYVLTSQIKRAADSIALNISEGAIEQSNPEFKKFIGYSIRSLAEVVTCLYKAKLREYITNEKFQQLYNESYLLMNMMIAFKKQLK